MKGTKRPLGLDGLQGADEKRTEPYLRYGEGVAQTATQRRARSAGKAGGSDSRSAGAPQRPFAVFDIDGTLIRWQLYHALADRLVKLGYIEPGAFQSISEARMDWKRRERSDSFKRYEAKLVKLYSEVMSQITPDQFDQAAEQVFEEYKDQVYTYTRQLIKSLKADGYHLFAISGSQVEIISKIADYYGFDDYVGTKYVQRGGKFTGEVKAPLGKKDQVLKEMVKQHGASWAGSIGVGDSQGDIKMMSATEQPIAFNPERELFEHARAHGWPIVIERKNMFYELEAKGESFVLA